MTDTTPLAASQEVQPAIAQPPIGGEVTDAEVDQAINVYYTTTRRTRTVAMREVLEQFAQSRIVATSTKLSAEPVKGKNYEQGLWSMRNYQAMLEDGDITQPVQPAPCRPLCELCVKRGYNACANTAKTTPVFAQPVQPARSLTDDDIQKIMEMLERHQTFNYEADCPVVAMYKKLKNMLAHGINPKDAQP